MNKIITISREFGSGGREIGKRLADELGFAYYDSEIINLLSRETGMSKEYINNISEKGIYPYAFQFAKSFSMYSKLQSNQTDLLVAQTKVIREIAEKGNCIIVGRGADTILDNYHPMKIFVYAELESKVKRCQKKAKSEENLSEEEIVKKIHEIDKNRKKYNDILSNKTWGEKENYDLCTNTTNINIKAIINPLAEYIKIWFKEEK